MAKKRMGRPTKYGDEVAPNVTITMPATLERAITHEAKLRGMSRSAMACKVLVVGMKRLAQRGIVEPLPASVESQVKAKRLPIAQGR